MKDATRPALRRPADAKAANDRGSAMTSSVTSMMLTALTILGGHATSQASTAAAAALPVLQTRAVDLASATERFVYLGSGPLTGLARESALQLLELTAGRVMGYFDSPLGFRHGPKSMLNEPTPSSSTFPTTPTRAATTWTSSTSCQARPRERVVSIGARADADETWSFPALADLPDAAVAPVLLLAAQHVALAQSRALGLHPDNPFPDSAVNRVVKGVTITHELDH